MSLEHGLILKYFTQSISQTANTVNLCGERSLQEITGYTTKNSPQNNEFIKTITMYQREVSKA